MNNNIHRDITEPVNRQNIYYVYGAVNNGNIENPVSTHDIGRKTNSEYSKSNIEANVITDVQSMNGGHKRHRVKTHYNSIVRGQKWNVMVNGITPNRIRICVGWELIDDRCEIDTSAFLLCQNEKVPSDEWFVFYGQNISPDGSVKYQSNKDNNLPDDAEIIIELNKVRSDIKKISICATIYESTKKNLNFGMVKNVYARILNESNDEICYIPIVDLPGEVTSLVIGELYRYNNLWKFCAISAGYKRDLAQFCNVFGVELE